MFYVLSDGLNNGIRIKNNSSDSYNKLKGEN